MERKKNKQVPSDYLTPADVARRLMVSPITVNQWAKKGWIKSFKTGGGHHRFLLEDLESFCRSRGVEFVDSDNGLKLLILDADLKRCSKSEKLIAKLSLNVAIHIANDIFTAGRYVERYKPDIVMIDLSLPGLNILELCNSLREEKQSMRIVTMYDQRQQHPDEESAEDQTLKVAAELLIPKPVGLKKLREFLKSEE